MTTDVLLYVLEMEFSIFVYCVNAYYYFFYVLTVASPPISCLVFSAVGQTGSSMPVLGPLSFYFFFISSSQIADDSIRKQCPNTKTSLLQFAFIQFAMNPSA